MRVRSWEEAGLDSRRVLAFATSVGASLFVTVALLGDELRLGSVSLVLGAMAGAGGCYIVSTAPRRSLRVATFEQTRDAPSFAASSNIYLASTSSRSKTLLMLRPEEKGLRSFMADVRRGILLGYDPPSAIQGAGPEGSVHSESVKTVLDSVLGVDRTRVDEGGDELDAILNSSGLDEETKLPVFIAVSFFLPIMLMLFAAMTKASGLASIAALAVLEVVILDIALSVSGSSVDWGTGAKP